MLDTSTSRRTQLLASIFVLSIFLISTIASAATEAIGKKGGMVQIAPGVSLVVPEDAVKKRTIISADMYWTADSVEFLFGPSPMSFSENLSLKITWEVINSMDLDDFTLYGPNKEQIQPVKKSWGLMWKIKHFSLYYYRRR